MLSGMSPSVLVDGHPESDCDRWVSTVATTMMRHSTTASKVPFAEGVAACSAAPWDVRAAGGTRRGRLALLQKLHIQPFDLSDWLTILTQESGSCAGLHGRED